MHVDNAQIPTSVIKSSSGEVYDKTSKILRQIQIHADGGCEHCLKILKSGLGRPTPNPADAGATTRGSNSNGRDKINC